MNKINAGLLITVVSSVLAPIGATLQGIIPSDTGLTAAITALVAGVSGIFFKKKESK